MKIKTRKATSLYGKLLEKAIEREEPWLQSQDLPNYLDFYVDRGQISGIRNNSSELIVGRRGTGKTHLLGSLKELVVSSNNEIAVFISIFECAQTPPALGSETTEFAANRISKEMFVSFLREFLYQFSDAADAFMVKKKGTLPKSEIKLLDVKLNDLFGKLLEAIEVGRKYSLGRTSRETIKELRLEKSNAVGDVSFKLSERGIKATLGVGLGAGRSGNIETKEEVEVENTFHIDLKDVRNITEDILSILRIDTLYILADEWMELEKATPSAIQPLFAQMLKITFFNSKHIAVKIASIWSQTTLYDRKDMGKSKGIQLGHDLIRGPDLDIDFIKDELEVHEFCKEMLFRRLKFVCPELQRLEDREGNIDDIFITELFDNTRNFNAFIAATHGIPRQLMHLFIKCAAKIKGDFTNHVIDYKLVSSISTMLYREQKRKAIDPASSAQKLLNTINNYMESNDRRTFLVESGGVSKSTALRKLVDEEHIHQIPSASTPRVIREKYKAFHIDFGNYADWVESKQEDISSLLSISILPIFGKSVLDNLNDYVIDISEYDEGIVDCRSCGFSFTDRNPVYLKFGSCPKCAEDIKAPVNAIE
ncbi:hypothetical protein L0668_01645 [Paraglaciecola aquimarina]|uniref:ATP-binding protein n=1 Tax=Paraglaciecola algarum TaxID=3050085 RepID=A0ABS9D4P8_9ALTE|nr:hypothetical protein [Paraglaciecola sp. G1-23]MCF2946794.1 hypothetical protein [Paraglaciecola sp. G1-23]